MLSTKSNPKVTWAKNFRDDALFALSNDRCCIRSCLFSQTASFEHAVSLLVEARNEIHNLDWASKKDYIRQLAKNCIKGIHAL